ncbi:VanW family protein [Candidatus Falkowbacteria bacterium]|nr:VanW family protein [Candidatus Falkowbacteria bacterium]
MKKIKVLTTDLTDDIKKISNVWKKWFFFISSIFLFFLLLLTLSIVVYREVYKNKIYPGASIGYFNIGGQTLAKADELLIGLTEKPTTEGLTFIIRGTEKDQQFVIPTIFISPQDPDLTREILSFDFNTTLDSAFKLGRTGNFFNRLKEQVSLLLFGRKVDLAYRFNQDILEQGLEEKISPLSSPGNNAELRIINGKVTVLPEKPGNSFDYSKAIIDTIYGIESLTFRPAVIKLKADIPKIRAADTILASAKARHVISFASTTLFYKDKSWRLENSKLEKLLQFKLADKKDVILSLASASTTAFLQELALEIDVEAQDAKFEVASTSEGRLKAQFQPASDGKKLNITENLATLEKEIIYKDNHEVELIIDITKPRVDLASINTYGIKEVVGVGESDFSGSPVNRRHNIKTGADRLNGLLIAPDEEFSLVKSLGSINAAAGYLPELVIKGNQTIAEYGGGLCQIGTTAFRVALYAGLPITERRPHSYRVSYYEPAGMDATIYSPRPDLRFINNTGNYLVLTTEIEGDILRFKLYGTNDNRQIEIENPPRIWNITYPSPTKIIETLDLAPGQKRCTESSHRGADTEFTRKVTYTDDREPIDESFFSRYRPWQAVCLVGVEVLTTATNTDEVIE